MGETIPAESWGRPPVRSPLRPRACALRRLRLSRNAAARRRCAACFFCCFTGSLMRTGCACGSLMARIARFRAPVRPRGDLRYPSMLP